MRYLKVTLLITAIVGLFVASLYETALLHRLDLALADFLGRKSPPRRFADRLVQYAAFFSLAAAVAWTTIDIPRYSLKFIVAAGVFAQILTATWVLNVFGIFFSPFGSLVATACSFVGGLLYAQSEAGSRKKLVRAIFGDRVSRRSFRTLVDSDVPLNFGGERCEASVVVCEIFNHDQLSEALSVTEYVAMNNAFLRNAADFLVDRGGYLDECDGESLRVVFGTPLPDPLHARTATAAALDLAERLEAVNLECQQIWNQQFDFRIGVNSGEIVVAAYGSRRLGTFSVAGEPVEFARRLCAANTIYGSRILIGAATFSQAELSIEVRPLELVQRTQDQRSREEVYELLAPRDGLSADERERRDLFWKGIVYYREQLWDEALSLFHSARSENGSDAPVEFYIRRIEQIRAGLPALDFNHTRL